MTSILANRLRCPYCLEEEAYLQQPKLLPCGHMFCSPCLEGFSVVSGNQTKFVCSFCSNTHIIDDIALLPNYVSEDSQHQDESGQEQTGSKTMIDSVNCERCQVDKSAVCYCVTCDRKLCRDHEEMHQNYFAGDKKLHKIISVVAYATNPKLYLRPSCELHPDECYSMCCRNCYSLKCSKCRIAEGCVGVNEHFYHTLEDTKYQLKSEIESLVKKCSERVTEMCLLEKDTWQHMDQLEVDCESLKHKVQHKADELIELIVKERDDALKRVMEFELRRKEEVETFLVTLRNQRESLEEMDIGYLKFIKETHVVDTLKQRVEMTSQLESKIKSTQHSLTDWSSVKSELQMGAESFMRSNIDMLPHNIELLSTQETDGCCYATNITPDGSIMIGCSGGITKFTPGGKSEVLIQGKVVSSLLQTENGESILYVHQVSGTFREVWKKTIQDDKVLGYALPHSDGSKYLTETESYIIATNSKGFEIFDKSQHRTTSASLSFIPRNMVSIAGTDTFYVTGDGKLFKYELLSDGKLQEIWSCPGLEDARGVCLTSSGSIIVLSCTTNTLCVVSPHGLLLKHLKHEGLMFYSYGQISLLDNKLTVPCWDLNKFMIFSL